EEERLRLYSSIRRELEELRAKGKTVFIILSIPVGGEFSPKTMTTRHLLGLEVRAPAPVSVTVNAKDKPVSDYLQSIAKETGALTIDPFQALCRDGFCLTADDSGRPAYRDGGHLRAGFVEDNATFIDRVFE